jgi:hypothetical protein
LWLLFVEGLENHDSRRGGGGLEELNDALLFTVTEAEGVVIMDVGTVEEEEEDDNDDGGVCG